MSRHCWRFVAELWPIKSKQSQSVSPAKSTSDKQWPRIVEVVTPARVVGRSRMECVLIIHAELLILLGLSTAGVIQGARKWGHEPRALQEGTCLIYPRSECITVLSHVI